MTAQLTMDFPVTMPKSVYAYGERASSETHGVVLTRRHVVELMLDLAGYTVDRDLPALSLLEPACGLGAFLLPAVERLLDCATRTGRPLTDLRHAVRAYDVDPAHVAQSRERVQTLLVSRGTGGADAEALAWAWIREGDFLLGTEKPGFDVVVGNPPYVRIEQLAPALQAEYRRRYATIYDRADLYVAFIERGLRLLAPEGVLCFVCADRWVLNKYGAPLRTLIAKDFRVRCYIDLHDASPFDSEVIAYPSIFALSPGRSENVFVGRMESATPEECSAMHDAWRGTLDASGTTNVYETWFEGDAPWVLSSPAQLRILRDLEARFKPLEAEDRARVGIGVASGCDKVYIVGADADIEADRLVPLVMRSDLSAGRIHNARRSIINTFLEDGGVVDLKDFARLAAYLSARGEAVRARNVAKRNPNAWFRTIDRVYPRLVATPKLLIPDIAGSNEVVFDEGHYLPHHNLYFVTSTTWDLEVLGGLLISRVALFFVWSYAVKMRGGYLRFQAQYLRRIRVPSPDDITPALAASIRDAFRSRDIVTLDALAMESYGLAELPDFAFVDTRR